MIESPRPFADSRPTAVFVFNALRPDAGRLTQTWLGRVRQFDAAGWATHCALINKDPELERSVRTLRSRGRLPEGTVVHHFATRDRRIRPSWRAPLAPGESIDPRVGDWLDWLTGQIPGAVIFADSPAAYPYLTSMTNPTVALVAGVNLIHWAGPEQEPGSGDGSANPLTGLLAPKFAERFVPVLDEFDAIVVMTRGQASDLRARFGADLPVEVIAAAVNPARVPTSNPQAEASSPQVAADDPSPAADARHRVAVIGALEPVYSHAETIRACAQLAGQAVHIDLVFSGTGSQLQQLRGLADELGIGDRVSLAERGPGEGAALAGAEAAVWTSARDATAPGIVRAIGAGVPVVALDSPYGPSEQITSAPLGRLVESADAGAIAAALAELLRAQVPPAAVRRAGAELLRRSQPDAVGREWVGLAERLSGRAWNPRRPTILLEGFGAGSRIMRVPGILANTSSEPDAWSMDLPGTRDPAVWPTAVIPTNTDDVDDDAPTVTHGPGAVHDLMLNVRSSLLAFAAHEAREPLTLELTDGSRRAPVLSTSFEPRVIASRVGSALLRREPDGSVVVEPYDDLLLAESLDGGLLVRRTPQSPPDEVTHAVDWVVDIDWSDVSPSDDGVSFRGTLRASGIAPAEGHTPAICVADVGGFSRIVGTLHYTAPPHIAGLDWSVPVAGSIRTDALVATTSLERGALTLHVGFRGQQSAAGSLWTHGERWPIHLTCDRGAVTLMAAAGGRVIAAPGRGRRARVTTAIRVGLSRG